MAFVLNAQLKIAAPTNLGKIRQQIQSGLNGLNTNVNVKVQINKAAINGLNSQLKQLNTNVGSVNKLNTSLSHTGKVAQQAAHGMATFSENIASSARRFAAFGLAALTFVKVVDGVNAATKSFIDYQHEMVKIGQVGTDTSAQLGKLDKNVRDLAVRFGASSNDIAKAASTLRQAGVEIDDVTKIIETLAKTTNTPSFGNIETTAKNVIAIYHQFGNSAEEVEDALNKINVASKKYATSSEDYITAIQRAGGAFKTAGGSLEELIGLFTSVKETTQESAETIGTAFKTIFNRTQSASVVKELKEVGINLRYSAEEAAKAGKNIQGRFVGPLEAMKRISTALHGINEQSEVYNKVISAFSGDRNLAKAIPLIKEFGKAQRVINDLKRAGNSLDEDNLKAQQSIYVQINKTAQAFNNFFAELAGNEGIQTFIKQTLSLTRSLLEVMSVIKVFTPALATLGLAKLGAIGIGSVRALGAGAGAGASKIPVRISTRKNAGGYIPGPDVNQDIVDMKATPGEFVINKKSARQIGYGNLERMNKTGVFPSKKQKFADGGKIGIPIYGINEYSPEENDIHQVFSTLGIKAHPKKMDQLVKSIHFVNEITLPHKKNSIIGGIYDNKSRKIAINNQRFPEYQLGILSHEIGHGASHFLGRSLSKEKHTHITDMIYRLPTNTVMNLVKMGKSGYGRGIHNYQTSHQNEEGFADVFRQVYNHRSGRIESSEHDRIAKQISESEEYSKIINALNHRLGNGIQFVNTSSGIKSTKSLIGYSGRLYGMLSSKKLKFANGGEVPQSSQQMLDDVFKHLNLSKVDRKKLISGFELIDYLPHPYEPNSKKGANGSFNPDTKLIQLSTHRGTRSQSEIRSSLAHEVGHSIHNLLSNNKMLDNIDKKNILYKASELGQHIDIGQFISEYPKERHQGEGIAETFRHIYDYKTRNKDTFGGRLRDKAGSTVTSKLTNYIKGGHKKVTDYLNNLIPEQNFRFLSTFKDIPAEKMRDSAIEHARRRLDKAEKNAVKLRRMTNSLRDTDDFDRAKQIQRKAYDNVEKAHGNLYQAKRNKEEHTVGSYGVLSRKNKKHPLKFANGGGVPGPDTNADTVDIKAMPGEYIINKKSAQKLGYNNLWRMNKTGNLPVDHRQKFSIGGKVGQHPLLQESDIEHVLKTLGLENIDQKKLYEKLILKENLGPSPHRPTHYLGGYFNNEKKELAVSSSNGKQDIDRQKKTFSHELGHSIHGYVSTGIGLGSKIPSRIPEMLENMTRFGESDRGLSARIEGYPTQQYRNEALANAFERMYEYKDYRNRKGSFLAKFKYPDAHKFHKTGELQKIVTHLNSEIPKNPIHNLVDEYGDPYETIPKMSDILPRIPNAIPAGNKFFDRTQPFSETVSYPGGVIGYDGPGEKFHRIVSDIRGYNSFIRPDVLNSPNRAYFNSNFNQQPSFRSFENTSTPSSRTPGNFQTYPIGYHSLYPAGPHSAFPAGLHSDLIPSGPHSEIMRGPYSDLFPTGPHSAFPGGPRSDISAGPYSDLFPTGPHSAFPAGTHSPLNFSNGFSYRPGLTYNDIARIKGFQQYDNKNNTAAHVHGIFDQIAGVPKTGRGIYGDLNQPVAPDVAKKLLKADFRSFGGIGRGYGFNSTRKAVNAIGSQLGVTTDERDFFQHFGIHKNSQLSAKQSLEFLKAARDHKTDIDYSFNRHASSIGDLRKPPPVPPVPPVPPNQTYLDVAKKLGFDTKPKGSAKQIRDLFAHIGVLTPTGKSSAHDLKQIISPILASRLSANGSNTFNQILKGTGISNPREAIDMIAQQLGVSGEKALNSIAPSRKGQPDYDRPLSAKESLKYIKAIDDYKNSQEVGIPGLGKQDSDFADISRIQTSRIGKPRGRMGFQDFLNANPHIKREDLHAQLQNKYEQLANRRFIPKRLNRASSVYGTPIEHADHAIDNNLQGHFDNGKFTKFAGSPYAQSEKYDRFSRKFGKGLGAASYGVGFAADIAAQQIAGDSKGDALLKGGLGGFGSGVIAGGAIGTALGGPGIGTAVGAIAGAALGATGALKQFEKQLSDQKLSSAIDAVSTSFQKFYKASSEKEENDTFNELIKTTSESMSQIKEKATKESIGTSGEFGNWIANGVGSGGSGIKGRAQRFFTSADPTGVIESLTGFSANDFLKRQLTTKVDPKEVARLQKAYSGTVISQDTQGLERLQQNYLDRHEGVFSKSNPKGISPEQFLAPDSQASKIIKQLAELKNPGDEDAKNKYIKETNAKITRELIDQSKVDKSLKTAELIETNFNELTKSIDIVTAKFNQLQQSTSGITAIFEGVAPQHVSRSDQVSSFGSNAFEGFAKNALGGVVDKDTLSQITSASRLQSLLPGIIGGIDETQLGPDGDSEAASKQFAKSIGKYKELHPSIVKSAQEYFDKNQDKAKLKSDIKQNPKKISESFIEGSVPGIKGFTKDAIGKIDNSINNFADQYAGGVERRNQGIDNSFKANSLREEYSQFAHQRIANRIGRPGDADLIGAFNGNTEVAFNRRQIQLGARSANPDQIAADLRNTQAQINQTTEERIKNPGKDVDATSKKLIDLRSKAQNLGKALENLTDVSKTSARALTLLNKVTEDKDAKRSFVEQYLSSDTAGREQINRAAGTTTAVIANGSLRGFNAEQQQETISFLRSVGKGRLGFAGGASGEDVLKKLIDEFSGGSGLDSREGPEEQALKNMISQNYEVAIRAQENLSGILQNTNETFFSQLQTNQARFLEELKSVFTGGNGAAPIVGKARGGAVGTDTVPAMLSPGEFIVSSKAAHKHRRLLEDINNGKDKKYLANGGLVDQNGKPVSHGRYEDPNDKYYKNPLLGLGKVAKNLAYYDGMAASYLPRKIFKHAALPLLQGGTALVNNGINHTLGGRPSPKTEEPENNESYIDRMYLHDYNTQQNQMFAASHTNKVQKEIDRGNKLSSSFKKSYVPVPKSLEMQKQSQINVRTRFNQRAGIDPNAHLKPGVDRAGQFVSDVIDDDNAIRSKDYSRFKKKDNNSYSQTSTIDNTPQSPFAAGLGAFTNSLFSSGSGRDIDTSGTIYDEQNKSRIRKYGDESLQQQAHRERQQTIQRRRQSNRGGSRVVSNSSVPQQQFSNQRIPQENSQQQQNQEVSNKKFGEQSQMLAQSLAEFTKQSAPLIEALNGLKGATIKLEQNGNLNVNINGIETLKSISAEVQKSIIADVLTQTVEIMNKKIEEMKSGPSL